MSSEYTIDRLDEQTYTESKLQTLSRCYFYTSKWETSKEINIPKFKEDITNVSTTMPYNARINIEDKATYEEKFQTYVGMSINNNINKAVYNIIEHNYIIKNDLINIGPAPTQSTYQTNMYLNNLTGLIDGSINQIVELSKYKDQITNNVKKISDNDNITYHEKYISGQVDNYKNILVSKTPILQFYKISPMMYAFDACKEMELTSKPSSIASISSLFGWDYISPQYPCLGSQIDLIAIIADMMWKILLKIPIQDDNEPIQSQDIKKLISLPVLNHYTYLIDDGVIETLSNLTTETGDINPDDKYGSDTSAFKSKDSYSNPFNYKINDPETSYIKTHVISDDVIREPELPLLTSISNITRSIYYDNSKFKLYAEKAQTDLLVDLKSKEINKKLDKSKSYQKYGIISISTLISVLFDQNQIIRSPLFNDKILFIIKTNILRNLINCMLPYVEGEEQSEYILQIKNQKEKIISTIKNIPDEKFKTIIFEITKRLIFELLKSYYFYDYGTMLKTINPDKSDLYVLTQTDPKLKFGDSDIRLNKLFKLAIASLNNGYTSLLTPYIGNSQMNPMGGLSLFYNKNISYSRYNTNYIYSGDVEILHTLNNYTNSLLSDLKLIATKIQRVLNNSSTMYWDFDKTRYYNKIKSIHVFCTNEIGGKTVTVTSGNSEYMFYEAIIKKIYTEQIKIIKQYVQQAIALESKIKRSNGMIDSQVSKDIQISSLKSTTSICYLKNQIHIIESILEKLNQLSPNRPRMLVAIQNSLLIYFKNNINDIKRGITNIDLLNIINEFSKNSCSKTNTVKSTYVKDEVTNSIISADNYWLLMVANLKNIQLTNIYESKDKLRKLYIFIKDGNSVYLFDIMPYILTGNLNDSLFGKSEPFWLSFDKLKKYFDSDDKKKQFIKNMNISETDQMYILSSNDTSEITNNYYVFNNDWLINLDNNASKYSNGDLSKKIWVIKTSFFLLLTENSIFETKSEKINKTNNNNLYSNINEVLLKIPSFINLISRSMLNDVIKSSIHIYQSL